MSVTVRKCKLADLEGNRDFPALVSEYAAECAIAGLPAPGEKIAAYRAIESSGIFHIYGAFLAEQLVGFIAILTPVIPHYGVAIAVTESFFVAKVHRESGAGLKLLRAAETHAEEAHSPGILVSAPSGGPLAQVLPRRGYRETNRVFFKERAVSDVAPVNNAIQAMSIGAVEKVRDLEKLARSMPQAAGVSTTHMFHAGMYARTMIVPAGVMITGALIKIATTLIVSGHAVMYSNDGAKEIDGYAVFAASAHRKQAFVALADTHLTMIFATSARNVEDAEREFTDESDLLISREAGADNSVLLGKA